MIGVQATVAGRFLKIKSRPFGWVIALTCVLGLALAVSLLIGPTPLSLKDFIDAVTHYDAQRPAHFALVQLRLPRAILAMMVGSALAASGLIMQCVSRNALAGPTLMGLNSGGTLLLLVGILANPDLSYLFAVTLSLAGALLGYALVGLVCLLAAGPMTPIRLALAGTVVSAVLGSVTQGLTILYSLHDQMLFWTMGGLAQASWPAIHWSCLPWGLGMLLALALAPSLSLLHLGTEVAAGLGLQIQRTTAVASFAVLVLTSSAIAVAGPVGFVGIMVPHLCRMVAGADYRILIPTTAIAGALLTLTADIAGRWLAGNQELPMGLFTTLLGSSFFIFMARRGRGSLR